MDLKSIPGSGRLAGSPKVVGVVVLAVVALGAYLTDSEALWAVVKQLAPMLLAGG